MKLKDAAIKAFEPSNKVVKHSDGASLFLLVHPSGTKSWVYAYRFDGKQKKLTLGNYPKLSLKDARKARQDARDLLDQGIDPGVQKQASKRGNAVASEIRAGFQAQIEAAREVRLLIGDVDPLAFDSAAQTYGRALTLIGKPSKLYGW